MNKKGKKERELELLELDDQIASKKYSIAEKKRMEKEARRQYGRNWRKVLGVIGDIRVNPTAIQTLYSANPNPKRR